MTTHFSKAAAQYAGAVMEIAVASSSEKTILENLRGIATVIKSSPDFEMILKHPGIKPADKKALLVATFGGKVDDLTMRILELLADKRRLDLVVFIAHAYEQLWRERQNIVSGTLIYAEKPDSRTLNEIKTRLQSSIGKTVELDEKEDKSLIGGYMLQVGDRIIDGSLKGRLHAIEKQLLSV